MDSESFSDALSRLISEANANAPKLSSLHQEFLSRDNLYDSILQMPEYESIPDKTPDWDEHFARLVNAISEQTTEQVSKLQGIADAATSQAETAKQEAARAEAEAKAASRRSWVSIVIAAAAVLVEMWRLLAGL